MPPRQTQFSDAAFPRPQGALRWVLGVIFGVWAVFGVLLNWFGVGANVYEALTLEVDRLFAGEIWRPFTAPLVHLVSGRGGVSHVLTTLLLIYFFGVTLQKDWGARRFLTVLAVAALVGELLQVLALVVLPAGVAARAAAPVVFGGHAMGIACIIAWGLSYRHQTMQFMFVIPMRGLTLVWITLALEVLYVIANGPGPEGLFAPFGGALVGYALGGATPSPLRRLFLRAKLRKLEKGGTKKGAVPYLRVVDRPRDSDPPPDKRWMNLGHLTGDKGPVR